MLQFIRNKLFPKPQQRTFSLESKTKQTAPQNRSLSIDSKQKAIRSDEKQKHYQRNDFPVDIYDIEEVRTIKYPSCRRNQAENMDFVSDIAEDQQLNELYPNLMQEIRQQYPLSKDRPPTNIHSSVLTTNHQQQAASRLIKTHLFEQSAKVFVKPQPPLKLAQKIKQQCSVCHLPLKMRDSLQLACTHRYHRNCAKKMQSDNRYDCSICKIHNGTFSQLQKRLRLPLPQTLSKDETR